MLLNVQTGQAQRLTWCLHFWLLSCPGLKLHHQTASQQPFGDCLCRGSILNWKRPHAKNNITPKSNTRFCQRPILKENSLNKPADTLPPTKCSNVVLLCAIPSVSAFEAGHQPGSTHPKTDDWLLVHAVGDRSSQSIIAGCCSNQWTAGQQKSILWAPMCTFLFRTGPRSRI